MDECIFCKIVEGKIPASVVYEGETVLAFEDIQPTAPVHVILVPKRHVGSMMDMGDGQRELAADIMEAAVKVARLKGVDETGFRLVINCGPDGGQLVGHLHMHLLGGRKLTDGMG
ncbi:MAG TPA: histidine triad nucleotide-binding protein [Deltaproteobacteria bacterium]|nr:histidine triad nucleotide-binding protein [Deltaproteobacteria bacterium]